MHERPLRKFNAGDKGMGKCAKGSIAVINAGFWSAVKKLISVNWTDSRSGRLHGIRYRHVDLNSITKA